MKGGRRLRTFGELYEDYNNSIAVQKNTIAYYRRLLSGAIAKANQSEVKRLNSILCVLYEEKSELEERAAEIKKYVEECPM